MPSVLGAQRLPSDSACVQARRHPAVAPDSAARVIAAECARALALAHEGIGHPGATENPQAAASPVDAHFTVHAFADVRYGASDSAGSRNGFALGQFDIFVRSQLSDDFSVLSETVISPAPRNQFTAKLERLLLTYSPSDYFTASVGRFHTGIGYYNSAYHHGTWFQTATGRPLIFAFEGDRGVVPVHTLGITAGGEVPSGQLGLRYVAELGSGRAGQASAAVAPQPSLGDNNTMSFNVGLIARPDVPDGLELGVSVYGDRLTFDNSALAAITETIGAAHVVYHTDEMELLAESVVMRHNVNGSAATHDTWGHYAEFSRRTGKLRPYLRFDHVAVPQSDPVFGFLGRRAGPTLGVRFDFDPLAALKVQVMRLDSSRQTVNRFDAQVAFTF